ncbi:hypothetical protein HanXRQr2_Chr15g0683411 [Helianthus annuus]|uniref:Uncharacterized protein n=1 Tax=Helianthus annuus TaxID=4232 RepID=A0A9K3DYA0_HELAN|nr:hypothetical protein HanXRQr2_Chr15g0683411 [Helianthus annuus]
MLSPNTMLQRFFRDPGFVSGVRTTVLTSSIVLLTLSSPFVNSDFSFSPSLTSVSDLSDDCNSGGFSLLTSSSGFFSFNSTFSLFSATPSATPSSFEKGSDLLAQTCVSLFSFVSIFGSDRRVWIR